MLRKLQTKSSKCYLAVAVLFALHLTQIEASPLKKVARRGEQKEVTDKPGGVPGIIVFGKGPNNHSVAEDADYQADSPWYKSKVLEEQFFRRHPSLMCLQDQMRFKAMGLPMKHFAVNQQPPMPLSHVPPTCGYGMPQNPFGLVLHAPYDGCYIFIQDGYRILPLLWHGIPVTLKCPTPEDPTVGPTLPPWHPWYPWFPGMAIPQTTATPQDPVFPHIHPGLSPHQLMLLWSMMFPMPSQPTTTPSPQDPFYQMPQALWLYYMQKQLQQGQDPELFLYLQWLMHQSQSPTPSPQNPFTQMPSNFWQHILHGHKVFPFPGQSATASPQIPLDILKHIYTSHQWPNLNHWPIHKGTASPNDPQQSWYLPQMPWDGQKWVTPTTTTQSGGTTTAPPPTFWWPFQS